jgi:hypothetical protein
VKERIEIKSNFSDWHEVTKIQAQRYVTYLLHSITAISRENLVAYIEKSRLRGVSVAELYI